MTATKYIKDLRATIGHDLILTPSVAAAILNDQNQLLLQEKHKEKWSLPAGSIEPGESPVQALRREIMEETGLDLAPSSLLGVFGGECFRYKYPNGDLVEYTVILMRCRTTVRIDDLKGIDLATTDKETKSLKYFTRNELPQLALPYPLELLYSDSDAPVLT